MPRALSRRCARETGKGYGSLLHAGLVDRVEVSLIPVVLDGGVPLLPAPAERARLKLRKQRVYEETGAIPLEYDVARG